MIINNRLLNVKEVSKHLSIGVSTVYAYVFSGALKAIRLPTVRESAATKHNRQAIRFKVEDVQEFIDNCCAGGLSSSNKEVKNGPH